MARDSNKREYVQLAHTYEPARQTIAGWCVSEKLDGMRCWWDGGVSRGLPASEVPYANTEKDARYIETPMATGLWTRYGNIIHAPDWFLDSLPDYCLDGEVWMGRGAFQTVMATVKDLNPSAAWNKVKYMVFDSPPPASLFADGEIRIQGYKKNLSGCYKWWKDRGAKEIYCTDWAGTMAYLYKNFKATDNLKLHEQVHLPFSTDRAVECLRESLDEVTNNAGEGLILRKPSALWTPKRVYHLLKVKKFQDAEATVLGYTTGRITDKGSKLLGLMGALITSYMGHRLELSGFTDEERILDGSEGPLAAMAWATDNPEKEVPTWITNPRFPRGSKVTFRYRELTDDGIPKEARYWRKA